MPTSNTPSRTPPCRIELSLDGSHACALLGPNLQEGEAEFSPIEGWPNATSKQEYAAMSAAYEALAKRIGDRPPFDIVREHTSASENSPCKATPSSYGGGASCDQKWTCEECGDVTDTERCPKGRENAALKSLSAARPQEPVAPFIELAKVLEEYDQITDRLDPRDYEADFVMRGADWRVVRQAIRSICSWPPSSERATVTDKMVDRFLAWRLPEDFHPDAGISFSPYFNVEYNAKQGKPPQRHQPIGTNLFTAEQARRMLEHVLQGAANSATSLTKREAVTLGNLLHLARALNDAMGDGEEMPDGKVLIESPHANLLELGLCCLDDLPDDRPGYTMSGPAKAEWALRRIIGEADRTGP